MPTRAKRHTRTVKRPPTNPRDRASITASYAPHVDTFLKDLRICAQQLAPLETCLIDELRILERLYYKGVNQHRSAIFWRRVKEARKLGKRIADMQLRTLIEDTRYAFYLDERAERQSKLLKAPWSRVPDMKFLIFVQTRVQAAEELLQEVIERLRKTYHSLELMLQTGAFLQTVLMLTGVVSRLHAVADELKACLSCLGCSLNAPLFVLQKTFDAPEGSTQHLQREGLDEIYHDIVNEGQEVSGLTRAPHAPETKDSSHNLNLTSISKRLPGHANLHPEPLRTPSESIITFVSNPNPPTAQPKRKQEEKSKEVKKKKKKRNAIDDIFASL